MDGVRWIGAFLLVLSGCPGDDDGTGGGDTEAGTESSPTSTAGSMSGSESESMTAGSMSGGSMSGGDTDSESESANTSDPGTDSETPTSTTDPTDDTTSGVDECAGLDRKECSNNEACRSIACQPIEMDAVSGTGPCLGAVEFVGCISADAVCAEVRTATCEGDDATVYICPDACIPDTWMECSPPDVKLAPCGDGG